MSAFGRKRALEFTGFRQTERPLWREADNPTLITRNACNVYICQFFSALTSKEIEKLRLLSRNILVRQFPRSAPDVVSNLPFRRRCADIIVFLTEFRESHDFLSGCRRQRFHYFEPGLIGRCLRTSTCQQPLNAHASLVSNSHGMGKLQSVPGFPFAHRRLSNSKVLRNRNLRIRQIAIAPCFDDSIKYLLGFHRQPFDSMQSFRNSWADQNGSQ